MERNQFTEEEKELLQHMGSLLILLQNVEELLSATLKVCFPGKNGINTKKLLVEDRRTLERFVNAVKKQTTLDPEFKAKLESLIHNRNFFIHRMCHQDWFDISTEEGRGRVRDFLEILQNDIGTVGMVLTIVMQEKTDIFRFATAEMHQQLIANNHLKYWTEHIELASRAIKEK